MESTADPSGPAGRPFSATRLRASIPAEPGRQHAAWSRVSGAGGSTTLAGVMCPGRVLPRTLVLAIALSLAPLQASAATDAGDGDVRAWIGRYCTPLGCRAAPASSFADAAGFAVAAAAVVRLARRRQA